VAEKPHDATVKLQLQFYSGIVRFLCHSTYCIRHTYRNLQRHRAVLPAIAWLSGYHCITKIRVRSFISCTYFCFKFTADSLYLVHFQFLPCFLNFLAKTLRRSERGKSILCRVIQQLGVIGPCCRPGGLVVSGRGQVPSPFYVVCMLFCRYRGHRRCSVRMRLGRNRAVLYDCTGHQRSDEQRCNQSPVRF